MRLAEAHATAEMEARIVRAIALVDAPPLCRFRRTPSGALLVEERSGRQHIWQRVRGDLPVEGRRSNPAAVAPPRLCEGRQALLDAERTRLSSAGRGVGLD